MLDQENKRPLFKQIPVPFPWVKASMSHLEMQNKIDKKVSFFRVKPR